MSDDDPTKPDLSLVDTDWLIEELKRRYNAMIFVREADLGSDTSTEVIKHGSIATCIGLAILAGDILRDDVMSGEDEGDDA